MKWALLWTILVLVSLAAMALIVWRVWKSFLGLLDELSTQGERVGQGFELLTDINVPQTLAL